jgi:hypothetical protein
LILDRSASVDPLHALDVFALHAHDGGGASLFRYPRRVPVNTGVTRVNTRASARTSDIEAPNSTAVDRYLHGLRVACRWRPWVVGVLRDITAQASQRPFLRARSGWCWFLTARLGGHDDGAIPSIRGGIEVALPIEDLVREAFAALSGGTVRLEVRDVLANDEHAVTLATAHGGRARPGDWNAMTSLSPTSPIASRPRPGGRHETSR